MKTCKTCKKEKTLDCFSTSGTSRKGTIIYNPHCKECRAKAGRDSRIEQVNKICSSCGASWKSCGGAGKRGIDLCNVCYKAYRKAYNVHHAAKTRAQKHSLDFNITLEFLFNKVRYGICDRTGLKFNFLTTGQNYSDRHTLTPSIDKIDPTKGYTMDNIQVVCWWYNLAKARYTDEEVLELCRAVVNHNS